MKKGWLVSFILMIFLLVVISGEAVSQTAAPKSGTNGAKRVVPQTGATPAPGQVTKAKKIVDVRLEKKDNLTQCTIVADGEFGKYETSKLGSPVRLVLDVKDVDTRFPRALIKNENPFIKEVRIGRHPDKVRFVFYPEGGQVPPFEINRDKDRLVVSFGNDSKGSGAEVASAVKSGQVQRKTPQAVRTVAYERTSGVNPVPTAAKTEAPVRVAQAAEIKKEAEPAPSAPQKAETGETPTTGQGPKPGRGCAGARRCRCRHGARWQRHESGQEPVAPSFGIRRETCVQAAGRNRDRRR